MVGRADHVPARAFGDGRLADVTVETGAIPARRFGDVTAPAFDATSPTSGEPIALDGAGRLLRGHGGRREKQRRRAACVNAKGTDEYAGSVANTTRRSASSTPAVVFPEEPSPRTTRHAARSATASVVVSVRV
jgi:hypothetical protein